MGGANQETIKEQMEKFNSPDQNKVGKLIEKTHEIHRDLMESLDKLVERGTKIETLSEMAGALQENSASFRREAVHLRRNMRWRDIKNKLLIACLVLVILFIVVWVCCGITF